VLRLELSPVRLSIFWDEVDRAGYGAMDDLLSEVERAGREVVLTVGMKAQGWPEFAIPERLRPAAPAGADVAVAVPALRKAVLELVQATVERYRGARSVIAWQVENEPLNRSGPHRWWIGPELVREELAAARRSDSTRPMVLNVFAAFDPWRDVAASRHGLRRLLGRDAHMAEAEALALLAPGDVLGLDVYRRIGWLGPRGGRRFATSHRWADNAARWRHRAVAAGRDCWITEAQAEPWEPAGGPGDAPESCRPEDVIETVEAMRDLAGCRTILLWGVEHSLAREAAGDHSWVRAIERLREASA
jgi:hypothetical protein